MNSSNPTWLVTGAAGFIGSCVVRQLIRQTAIDVVSFDALTYAGNPLSLGTALDSPRHRLIHADIRDAQAVCAALAATRPCAILHLAAESHVDRSIVGPGEFISTNVIGTLTLLEATLDYWKALAEPQRSAFRFLHVSTDEVFGSLGTADRAFTETSACAPNSPYSASKAASDHLVRAWHHTYGLPTLTTHCSNNYGPFQFPEKLVPVVILNALEGKPIPVYGDGRNVRDWLYVEDHARALRTVLECGEPGQTYAIGGGAERTNIDLVRRICDLLDQQHPPGAPHQRLIRFVADRPGHDRRYAIDCSKIERELDWRPHESFDSGLQRTVQWYLDNSAWLDAVRSGEYRRWMQTHYEGCA